MGEYNSSQINHVSGYHIIKKNLTLDPQEK